MMLLTILRSSVLCFNHDELFISITKVNQNARHINLPITYNVLAYTYAQVFKSKT